MTLVAVDVSAIPSDPRGAGRYVVEVVRALNSRGNVGLHLIARRNDGRRWNEIAPAARIAAVAPVRRPVGLLWEQFLEPRELRRHGVDVHHGPHYTMPERAPLPRVVTIHDLTFFDHPEWHERHKVRVFRRAIKVAARRADALICVSAATARRLEDLLTPTAPVHVVHHGVDHERFQRRDEPTEDIAALARLGIRAPYIAYVGTIEPRKDVPTLVRAFERLAESDRELVLVLAGGAGWGADDVGATIRDSPAAARIMRLGYVDDSALPALLRQAAVVAYPSRQEGFGLTVLEALACGTPVVTTAASVMAEVADGAAVLAEPGDAASLAGALERAMAADDAQSARTSHGLVVAAAHTWEASAAGHEAVYRSVMRHRVR